MLPQTPRALAGIYRTYGLLLAQLNGAGSLLAGPCIRAAALGSSSLRLRVVLWYDRCLVGMAGWF